MEEEREKMRQEIRDKVREFHGSVCSRFVWALWRDVMTDSLRIRICSVTREIVCGHGTRNFVISAKSVNGSILSQFSPHIHMLSSKDPF
jgi:hypothetical protein